MAASATVGCDNLAPRHGLHRIGIELATVAPQRSKRQSRKRRNPAATPAATPSRRREQRAARQAISARQARAHNPSPLGAYGERPPSPFGGLPISEVAIFAGAVAFIVGLVQGGGAALVVGFIVCALGVSEVTAREHFSGYRSHASLLAAIPSIGLELGLGAALGGGARHRAVLIAAVVPVFAVLFWLLRRRFIVARQARLARPPGV
jgi:hypothetical protein